MKRIANQSLIALLIVAVLLMMTVGIVLAVRGRHAPGPVETSPNGDFRYSVWSGGSRPADETPPSAPDVLKTTVPPTTEPPVVHHYSHIIVFLDVQRVVMYHTTEDGEAIPEKVFRCSTGARAGTTPITPPDRPFIISGYASPLLLFTKARVYVWVRYATHVDGDIFFHSQPYDYVEDPDGKVVPVDFNTANIVGYNILGERTVSNGCIRLSLRDAKFVANNVHPKMPVYIFESSKGYEIPEAEPLPPANLNSRWDPTDEDPACHYRQRDADNLAWKYRPKKQRITTTIDVLPDPVEAIDNMDAMPAGTRVVYDYTPDVSVATLRTAFIRVIYPDDSYDRLRIKIEVIDPHTPTTIVPTDTKTTEPTPPATVPPEVPPTTPFSGTTPVVSSAPTAP